MTRRNSKLSRRQSSRLMSMSLSTGDIADKPHSSDEDASSKILKNHSEDEIDNIFPSNKFQTLVLQGSSSKSKLRPSQSLKENSNSKGNKAEADDKNDVNLIQLGLSISPRSRSNSSSSSNSSSENDSSKPDEINKQKRLVEKVKKAQKKKRSEVQSKSNTKKESNRNSFDNKLSKKPKVHKPIDKPSQPVDRSSPTSKPTKITNKLTQENDVQSTQAIPSSSNTSLSLLKIDESPQKESDPLKKNKVSSDTTKKPEVLVTSSDSSNSSSSSSSSESECTNKQKNIENLKTPTKKLRKKKRKKTPNASIPDAGKKTEPNLQVKKETEKFPNKSTKKSVTLQNHAVIKEGSARPFTATDTKPIPKTRKLKSSQQLNSKNSVNDQKKNKETKEVLHSPLLTSSSAKNVNNIGPEKKSIVDLPQTDSLSPSIGKNESPIAPQSLKVENKENLNEVESLSPSNNSAKKSEAAEKSSNFSSGSKVSLAYGSYKIDLKPKSRTGSETSTESEKQPSKQGVEVDPISTNHHRKSAKQENNKFIPKLENSEIKQNRGDHATVVVAETNKMPVGSEQTKVISKQEKPDKNINTSVIEPTAVHDDTVTLHGIPLAQKEKGDKKVEGKNKIDNAKDNRESRSSYPSNFSGSQNEARTGIPTPTYSLVQAALNFVEQQEAQEATSRPTTSESISKRKITVEMPIAKVDDPVDSSNDDNSS